MNKKFQLCALGMLAVAACSHGACADVQLNSLFTSNMVLQRDQMLPVWGTASAGEKVSVAIGSQKQKTIAAPDGSWRVVFKPLSATTNVPFQVTANNTIELANVAAGDVYLCAGQSNMEMGVTKLANATEEIAAAYHPNIRLMLVARQQASSPQKNLAVPAKWEVCTPQTIVKGGWGGFSAVAYFFGRELNQKLNVPIGLLNSDWGGTVAQAWTSRETLLKRDDLRAETLRAEASFKGVRMPPNTDLQGFLKNTDSGAKANWNSPDFDDANWENIAAPFALEQNGDILGNYRGIMWYRRAVEIPAAWEGRALTLHLGALGETDATYFNGAEIGATTDDRKTPRVYTIPANLVKAGRAVIAVRVLNTGGLSGLIGGDNLRLQLANDAAQTIALSGDWRSRTSMSLQELQPLPPPNYEDKRRNAPTLLYNAMIAPLNQFALKGVIWYQGEYNDYDPAQYRTLFPQLIADWRAHRGASPKDLPFYFVQLANFKARTNAPVEKGWAELRDAQANALNVAPNTGMATIIDIGDAKDIHPKNKVDVGHRLALIALAKTYGRDIEYSGPNYESLKLDGAVARVQFSHAQGLKTTDGAAPLGFAIQDANGTWFPADARIEKNAVVLSNAAVAAPRAVRYAWANNPAVNLVNSANLPASPFLTDTGDLSAPIVVAPTP